MNIPRLWPIVGVLACLAAPSACAADASAWDQDARAAVRLIAGNPLPDAPDGTQRAGIEFRLASGWKTYWRYPGDSGIPPRFDFTRSENVKAVTVLWPAPRRFSDEAGQTIGYKDHIVFPLRVVPVDKSRRMVLRLNLDYAVCDKLCVPMASRVQLPLDGASSAQEGVIVAAEARVPTPAALERDAPADGSGLAVTRVHRDTSSARPRVVVDVAVPGNASVDLLAEGPTPAWALPLPQAIDGAHAGTQRFAFDLDGLPSGATAEGASLTLTAIAGQRAIEVKARLD